MSEEAQTGESQSTEAGTQQQSRSESKTVPLSEHAELRQKYQTLKSKLGEIEAAEKERERAQMSAAERFKAEADELRAKVQTYEVKNRKAEAIRKAKGQIGDGWTIDHAETDLELVVEKMAFDPETIDADVARLFNASKRAKQPEQLPITGTPASSPGSKKPPTELSSQELAEIYKTDPDRAREIIKTRRNAFAGFGTPPNQD